MPDDAPAPDEPLVDTHVHVWDLDGDPPTVTYPWLTSGPLHRTHALAEVAPAMRAAGVGALVLVQAADSLTETDALLGVAASSPLSATVVGWLPLADADACRRRLDASDAPALVGVRHLVHDEPDPGWLLRADVDAGLFVLERAGLVLDVPAERPDLLDVLPVLADRHPGLVVVLDHLGKPPVTSGWGSEAARLWARQVAEVARRPTTVAKLSGLELARPDGSTAGDDDVRPFVEHALACFGSDRMLLGGDWPVSTLQADYATVMGRLSRIADALSPDERADLRHRTARRVYRVGV
ncbi:amidohydrolase family protein [Cellulomonas endophytica]|uniref:amidohydrolase family protein n=1 Tax=Cellulomonas endophytica TaxID=2494735 RepID=UPI001010B010|nr:amidohydrolase family protein [Cellulomonas endophytica]